MAAISVLLKPASGMCNMACEYCFYRDEAGNRSTRSYGFMTPGTLKNVIRRTLIPANEMVSYCFQGGEPTLIGIEFFEKAIALQKQYNRHQAIVKNTIQTNGYAIDEQWCEFFKKNHFLVGISVDGTKSIHDKYRHAKDAASSYERVLHTIQLLEQYQIEYNILTVVTKEIAMRGKEIYQEYAKNGWQYQQYIACLDPLREKRGEHSYSVSPEEYGRFLIDLFDCWYQDCKKGKMPYIRQFENCIGILKGYRVEACDQGGTCGIQYVVEADGSVYPCDFYAMDEYVMGNLNTDRLEQIQAHPVTHSFIERSKQLAEDCLTCQYYSICRGGCQRYRDYHDKTSRYINYYCESCKMFFDACLERMQNLAKVSGTF